MAAATKTASQKKAGELHATSKIMEVDLAKLHVDLSYQREPSRDLADRIADDWDEVASELILVSDRGPRPDTTKVTGGLFIVNGQHRTLAAKSLGLEFIWARIINLRKEANPAAVEASFRLKTNVRLSDRPLERFKAQLIAGNEESKEIVKILARFDTEINAVPTSEFGVNCVSTVESIYRYDEGALLDDMLSIVKEAYGEIRGRHASAALFRGIAWFIEVHSADIDRSRLISKLRSIQVVALEARARTHASIMGKSLWVNVYRSILELYNEKLTKGRIEFQLRGAHTFAGRGTSESAFSS